MADIWELFEKPPGQEKTKPDVICKSCQELIENAHPLRYLVRHVVKYSSIPDATKFTYLAPYVQRENYSNSTSRKRRQASDIEAFSYEDK